MSRALAPLLLGVFVCLGAAVLAGCEESFDPFEESDVTFSLFGYVDAAADTQFVRVAALRQSAFEEESVDVVVTLEDLGSGTVATLHDSVVRFDNGAVVHNFWTTMPVEPGTAYRLTATGSDGRTASAAFATPPQFPNPELESGVSPYSSPQFPPTAQSMSFTGIEKFADLRITYVLEDPNTTVTVSYLERLARTADGSLILGFNAYEDVQRALTGTTGTACPGLSSAYVFVAAATEAWPDLADLDAETLALPGTASNVEGGLGYVGGIITRSGVWEGMRGVFGLHREGCLG